MTKNGKQKQSIFAKERKIETNLNSFTITVRPDSTISSVVEIEEDQESNDEDTDSAQVLDNIRTVSIIRRIPR